MIYPLGIEFDVLHRLRLRKQNHLLYDVHLIVGIDGLMELSIIWKTQRRKWKWVILKAGDSLWVIEKTWFFWKWPPKSAVLYLFQWKARRRLSPCLGFCARRSVCSAHCVSAAGEHCGSRCPSGNGPWQSWALYQACARTTGYPFAWRGWSRTARG